MSAFENRTHICYSCGAALELPVEGGEIHCDYCGVSIKLRPRTVSLKALTETRPPDHPKEEIRLRSLWEQRRKYNSRADRCSPDKRPREFAGVGGLDHNAKTEKRLLKPLDSFYKDSNKKFDRKEEHRIFWIITRFWLSFLTVGDFHTVTRWNDETYCGEAGAK